MSVVSRCRLNDIPFRLIRNCLSAGKKSLPFPGAAFCLHQSTLALLREKLTGPHLPDPCSELVGQEVPGCYELLCNRRGISELQLRYGCPLLTWCNPPMLLEL